MKDVNVRTMPEDWALPALDRLNETFFTAGRIVLQACKGCGSVQHPPEELCHRCQGTDFQAVESAGRGSVYSFVVAHHAAHPSLGDRVPYVVALVALDDFPDVRIVGNLLDVAPSEVAIDRAVEVVFEEIETDDGILRLPQWRIRD